MKTARHEVIISGSGGHGAGSPCGQQQLGGRRPKEIVRRHWRSASGVKIHDSSKPGWFHRSARDHGQNSSSELDDSERANASIRRSLYKNLPRSVSADGAFKPKKSHQYQQQRIRAEARQASVAPPRYHVSSPKLHVKRLGESGSSDDSTMPCSSPTALDRPNPQSSWHARKELNVLSNGEVMPPEEDSSSKTKPDSQELDDAAGKAILQALLLCSPNIDPATAKLGLMNSCGMQKAHEKPPPGPDRKGDENQEMAAAVAAALAWSPTRCARPWEEVIEEGSCECDEEQRDDPENESKHMEDIFLLSKESIDKLGRQDTIEMDADIETDMGNRDSKDRRSGQYSTRGYDGVLTFGDLVKQSSLKRREAQRLALTSSPSPANSGSQNSSSWRERDTALLLDAVGVSAEVEGGAELEAPSTVTRKLVRGASFPLRSTRRGGQHGFHVDDVDAPGIQSRALPAPSVSLEYEKSSDEDRDGIFARSLRRAVSCTSKFMRSTSEGKFQLLEEGLPGNSTEHRWDGELLSMGSHTVSGGFSREECPSSQDTARDTGKSFEAPTRVGAISPRSATGCEDGNTSIPYHRLAGVDRQWPRGVNPASREEWLSADEFATVFGMSFGAFRKLPWWRRRILKQQVALF